MNKQLEQELEKLQRKIELAQNRLSSAEAHEQRLTRANLLMAQQLSSAEEKVNALSTEVGVIELKIADKKREFDLIQPQIDEKEKSLEEVKKQILVAENDLFQLKEKAKESISEHTEAVKKLALSKKEEEELGTEITNKRLALLSLQAAVDTFIRSF